MNRSKRTFCINDHPQTPENIYTFFERGSKRNKCRPCHNEARQRRQNGLRSAASILPTFFARDPNAPRVEDHSRCVPGVNLCADCLVLWSDAVVATAGVEVAA